MQHSRHRPAKPTHAALLLTLLIACIAGATGCTGLSSAPERLDPFTPGLSAPLLAQHGERSLADVLGEAPALVLFREERDPRTARFNAMLTRTIERTAAAGQSRIIEIVRASSPQAPTGNDRWLRLTDTGSLRFPNAFGFDYASAPAYLWAGTGTLARIDYDRTGHPGPFTDLALGLPTQHALVGNTLADAVARFGAPEPSPFPARRPGATALRYPYEIRATGHVAITSFEVVDGVIVAAETARRPRYPTSAGLIAQRSYALEDLLPLDYVLPESHRRSTLRDQDEAPPLAGADRVQVSRVIYERVGFPGSVERGSTAEQPLEPGTYRVLLVLSDADDPARAARIDPKRTIEVRPGDRVLLRLDEILVRPDRLPFVGR